ncbi:uncharacterized protein Z520_01363 [Fonsecaea multimorphosa CBS 102226]|uniref:Uncharacterized protein n=1 Tax=Fonsecaea multimorphosa CBS 102226 TaxID=1442371 RepID=A0A0D2KA53_9EURO|nr:uncharacterized protein Z520_01363 [Fonsecaea multimorphosa CBS 102226]KIY02898.1 hypothetical protein Z520_01363 [Fonsecaea multimorphosa CBS 102226]OAL30735.1 hypothetical protein AYO22_01355 [Fonsecaea multimorphosa]
MEELRPNMTLFHYEVVHAGSCSNIFDEFIKKIHRAEVLGWAMTHKIGFRLQETLGVATGDFGDLAQAQIEEAMDDLALYVEYQDKAEAALRQAQSIVEACAKLFTFMASVPYTDENSVRLPPEGPEERYWWSYELIDLVQKAYEAMWDDDIMDVAFDDIPEEVLSYP